MSTPPSDAAIRLSHFSDVHVTVRPLGWAIGDWFNRRLTGWVNIVLLGRGYRFRDADAVLKALAQDLQKRRPDHLVFSGDATTLGFESEFTHAARLLEVGTGNALPGIAVPGNHDYYTRSAAQSGLFEKYFAAWQVGERVGGASYPFAQRCGGLWLVGVNTSTASPWPWDASSRIDAAQLERLRLLLERLPPGPRILVTHYPVCVSGGHAERRTHGLRNAAELVAVAARGGVCLWLHGHRHHPYHVTLPDAAPFPIICSGSGTQNGIWTYAEYEIAGASCRINRRVYAPATGTFEDEPGTELTVEFRCAR